ncbi:MAG: hypothetical protein Q4B26_12620 [Eubacteriales bacterium]|nr:hypothetical protein [Eubacteriales bacterium]
MEKKVDDLQQQNKALSAYVTDITDRVKQENSKNGIPAKEESVSIRKEHEENHKIAIDQIQGKISAAKTAKEIYAIFLEAGEKNTEFLNELKRLGDLERIYGTMVNEARKIISEYYK